MTAQLAPTLVAKYFDNNGAPLFNGQLFTYQAGTTTPQATYVDSTQTTQNTNPILLNARGECNLWLDPTKVYKFVLKDTLGNTISTVDNVGGGGVSTSAAGVYSAPFATGYLQYCGPSNTFAANVNFEAGTNLPNPSGVNGPALLLGSGGGSGTNVSCWIITDQAFDNVTPGNTLGITAGETQGAGTANGGELWLIGGASFGGTGGELLLQGGTSANGPGGITVLQGGNNTGNNAAAGDVFVEGGTSGNAGANVHLIATLLNGVAGDVRIRINSTILIQFLQHGEIYLTASGTGAGLAGQPLVSGGVGAAAKWQTGFTGTITTAKLTTGGTNGSMTFASGILTSQVAAT